MIDNSPQRITSFVSLARAGAGLFFAAALAACDPLPVMAPAPPVSTSIPATVQPSTESRALAAHYAAVETSLLSRGLMRTDDGSRDAPFTTQMLADNFLRIALYDEYAEVGGALVAKETPSALRRWEQPVRLAMIHGAGSAPDRVTADKAELSTLAARLARATRHPVRMVDSNANFTVLVLDEDERRAYGGELRRLIPGISQSDIAAITGLNKSTFCAVLAFSTGTGKPYTRAVAVIRAEHPPGLRSLCLHEEVAQGLGLANDAPIRPSIFNDDEEFALLTRHDELLLQMIYDPRLRTGMTEAQAQPIVGRIARELVGGDG